MADSPQVQPLPGLVEGGFADLGAAADAAAAADPAAAAHHATAAAVQDVPIHSHRIGCVLHILHISVTAGLTTPCFMGPLGVGSWHEWKEDHLVALLGSVWYNISRSNTCNSNFQQFKKMVTERFPGLTWKKKFVKPAETRWMVIWEGAALLDERWEELKWVFRTWAAENLLGTPFQKYWLQAAYMLQDPVIRVHAHFATELGKLVLNWAYHWLRGKGGFFVEREGLRRQLPPAMRFVEVADFSLELRARFEELRANKDVYFKDMIQFAEATLDTDEVSFFCCTKNSWKVGGLVSWFSPLVFQDTNMYWLIRTV